MCVVYSSNVLFSLHKGLYCQDVWGNGIQVDAFVGYSLILDENEQ